MTVASSNTSVEICGPISLLTLDIILRCAFSYQSNCQDTGYMVVNHDIKSSTLQPLQASVSLYQVCVYTIKNSNSKIVVSHLRLHHNFYYCCCYFKGTFRTKVISCFTSHHLGGNSEGLVRLFMTTQRRSLKVISEYNELCEVTGDQG